MAGVVFNTGEERKPWELHLEYLALLEGMVRSADDSTVVAGDFNQHVPRSGFDPHAVAQALTTAFEPMTIATSGIIPGCEKVRIDHDGAGVEFGC